MNNNQLIPGEKSVFGEPCYESERNDADWPPKISREFTAWNSPSPSTRSDCLNGYFQ